MSCFLFTVIPVEVGITLSTLSGMRSGLYGRRWGGAGVLDLWEIETVRHPDDHRHQGKQENDDDDGQGPAHDGFRA